jgi:hypothetical protein
MEYVLIAIMYRKTVEFFRAIKWTGYVVIAVATSVSYFHYQFALDAILQA